jgi:hypothetical protein
MQALDGFIPFGSGADERVKPLARLRIAGWLGDTR